MSWTLAQAALLLCAGWATYTLWATSYLNGLLDALLELQKPGAILPSAVSIPVQHDFTRIRFLDNQIVTMLGFFWPAIDGGRADVSLVALEIAGQVIAAWLLIVIESLRVGNRPIWVLTTPLITGLLMQNLGFGLVTPIWLYIHLLRSPTVSATSGAGAVDLVSSTNPLPLLTLPLSTVLAFFIPNTLMSLSPPHRFSPDYSSKQVYTVLAQFWPLYLSAAQFLLPIALSILTSRFNAVAESDKKAKSLKYLRRCYAFALFSATIAHLIAYGVPLLASLFPALFHPTSLPQLGVGNVFFPRSPLPPVSKITSLADGVLGFLQWDLWIGSVAVWVWALALRAGAQGRKLWAYERVEGLARAVLLAVVCGPCGAAVAVVWERDELVWGRGGEGEGERGKKTD